jgi:DNA topoisomerase-1
MEPAAVTMEMATMLLSLPRVVGVDPADGVTITAQNGRYGPYITKDKDSRTLNSHDEIFTITLEQALALLAQPRKYGRRGTAKPPLKEFGNDPVSGLAVVAKDGRFGVYVTDGVTNASLTRGDRVEFITPERAFELLANRRENPPEPKGPRAKKAARATKEPAGKKAATTDADETPTPRVVKKALGKKAAVKKASKAVKKAPTKKRAAAK